MDFWNQKNLPAPPTNTFKPQTTDLDLAKLRNALQDCIKHFKNENFLVQEAALLSRIVYRMKMKFRSSKEFKSLEKINHTLSNYLNTNISRDLKNIIDLIPSKYLYDTYLPTRNMLSYILVRMQGLVKLMERIYDTCKVAAYDINTRMHIGHFWKIYVILFALVSRIYILVKFNTKQICELYGKLLPQLNKLENTGRNWLPEGYNLPADLREWLGVDWVYEEVFIDLTTRDSTFNQSIKILDFFNLVDDDDDDVQFCDEYILVDQEDRDIANSFGKLRPIEETFTRNRMRGFSINEDDIGEDIAEIIKLHETLHDDATLGNTEHDKDLNCHLPDAHQSLNVEDIGEEISSTTVNNRDDQLQIINLDETREHTRVSSQLITQSPKKGTPKYAKQHNKYRTISDKNNSVVNLIDESMVAQDNEIIVIPETPVVKCRDDLGDSLVVLDDTFVSTPVSSNKTNNIDIDFVDLCKESDKSSRKKKRDKSKKRRNALKDLPLINGSFIKNTTDVNNDSVLLDCANNSLSLNDSIQTTQDCIGKKAKTKQLDAERETDKNRDFMKKNNKTEKITKLGNEEIISNTENNTDYNHSALQKSTEKTRKSNNIPNKSDIAEKGKRQKKKETNPNTKHVAEALHDSKSLALNNPLRKKKNRTEEKMLQQSKKRKIDESNQGNDSNRNKEKRHRGNEISSRTENITKPLRDTLVQDPLVTTVIKTEAEILKQSDYMEKNISFSHENIKAEKITEESEETRPKSGFKKQVKTDGDPLKITEIKSETEILKQSDYMGKNISLSHENIKAEKITEESKETRPKSGFKKQVKTNGDPLEITVLKSETEILKQSDNMGKDISLPRENIKAEKITEESKETRPESGFKKQVKTEAAISTKAKTRVDKQKFKNRVPGQKKKKKKKKVESQEFKNFNALLTDIRQFIKGEQAKGKRNEESKKSDRRKTKKDKDIDDGFIPQEINDKKPTVVEKLGTNIVRLHLVKEISITDNRNKKKDGSGSGQSKNKSLKNIVLVPKLDTPLKAALNIDRLISRASTSGTTCDQTVQYGSPKVTKNKELERARDEDGKVEKSPSSVSLQVRENGQTKRRFSEEPASNIHLMSKTKKSQEGQNKISKYGDPASNMSRGKSENRESPQEQDKGKRNKRKRHRNKSKSFRSVETPGIANRNIGEASSVSRLGEPCRNRRTERY